MSRISAELFTAGLNDKLAARLVSDGKGGYKVEGKDDLSARQVRKSQIKRLIGQMGEGDQRKLSDAVKQHKSDKASALNSLPPYLMDKLAAAVTAAELEGFEPTGDPSLTFQNVADGGCPYTQQLLMAHPELANEPYDETIINVLGLQPQTPGIVPAVMPQAVPAVVNPELAGAAGGGYGMPLSMIGGGVLGAAAGGALGNYIGNQYDSIDPNNAALIGAGIGGLGGAAGGWLLNRWLGN